LYWLATLGTFLVAAAAPNLLQSTSASLPHLVHSLLFVPYPNKLGLLQPTLALGWTLNYEMYFYVLFTVGLTLTPRFAAITSAALLVIVAIAIRLAGAQDRAILFYAEPIVCEFCFGVIVYYLAESASGVKPSARQWAGFRPVLLLAAAVAAIGLPLQERLVQGDRALWAGVPAAILVLAAILLERRYKIAATNKYILLLGDSSYVLYLIHPYVLYGVIRLFLDPPKMGWLASAVAIVALMLAAALAAIGVHVAIERPVLAYLRRKFAPKRLAPVPVAI
jgi:exopolysaccharide production protein ExoZ